MRRTALQQAVRKAPRGCADVEAESPLHTDLPMIERGGQLEPASAHKGHIVAQQANAASPANRSTGLVHFLLIHQHPARKDQRARPFAAGRQSAFHQQNIDAAFLSGSLISHRASKKISQRKALWLILSVSCVAGSGYGRVWQSARVSVYAAPGR